MLFGYDVIHLMRRCNKFLWKQTILAAIPRPLNYLPAQLSRVGAPWCVGPLASATQAMRFLRAKGHARPAGARARVAQDGAHLGLRDSQHIV